MKLVCYEKDDVVLYGVVEDNHISRIKGSIFDTFSVSEERISLQEVRILPPCRPGKAVCIGLNYRDHAKEMGLAIPPSPVVFLKPATAVIGHMDSIQYPEMSKRVDFECELAIVIKKLTKNISMEDAKDAILGYTCGNDVTARDLQPSNGQWTIAKSFDTFLPLGPWIETDIDPSCLAIKTYLNGEIKQSSNTRNLIFDVYTLVSFVSRIMTLEPGDVIMTGTPSGIAPMQKGDEVAVEIEGVGRLVNYVE
jgi:2-keto-4-pentenoate hydratase/2-oxohepta-3-ene-1,7-dioic acid hydratase in catechol pathway